jgi:leader peptidase (prepilin peptidase) / N-methyltransferase
MASHLVLILFLFALGASVGSFLNVVVWRMPRIEHDPNDRSILGPMLKTIEGLSNPPSHCPKCNNPLKWYDNIPVLGWIKLGGKCRFCGQPISMRYPTVEAIAGLLFVFYYVMFFIVQFGPCAARPVMVEDPSLGAFRMIPRALAIQQDWPIYLLYMFMIGGLLASSLIDAELFIIPIEIPWALAAVGILTHTIIDKPSLPGALNATPSAAALAIGGALGLVVSIILFRYNVIPQSFPEGEPMQDAEPGAIDPPAPPMTRGQVTYEMGKEIVFLLPPMVLSIVAYFVLRGSAWDRFVLDHHWFSGFAGAVLGALVGALVVWITRILGTLAFGRLAMGLGDVHLMFGVGAIIGGALATVAFFIAPFFGIVIAIYMLLTGKRREIPYGPYLSLGTAFVLLFGCPLLGWLTPGAKGLSLMLHELIR